MSIINTRALAELEQALLDAHAKAPGDPPVQDWPSSVAVRQIKQHARRGQPSELLEFAISATDLRSSGACHPVAVLLSSEEPWKLLGITEWLQDTEQPIFATVVSLDVAVLAGGPAASLVLQIRHVSDPFWDAEAADAAEVLQRMPMLGRASFKLREALQAPGAGAGSSGKLALTLRRAEDGTGDRDALAGCATLHVRAAAGYPPNRLMEPHATCNFAFGLGAPEPRELRVCEHMLPCAYGRSIPCAVLAMLCADAEEHAAAATRTGISVGAGAGAVAADAGLAALWELQDAAGWARLAKWLHELLRGVQEGARPSGFKESARKKERALAPVPSNLQLNLLEVQATGDRHAVYPTVSVGAPAAHCLGFADGGAAGLAERLAQCARDDGRRPPSSATRELSTAYAARCSVLMAQAYATLGAAFALACQTHAARRNRAFFAQLHRAGFLLQTESLLSTRGDDWGMLQDLDEAWRYLGAVQLVLVAPDGGGSGSGDAGAAVATAPAATAAAPAAAAPAAAAPAAAAAAAANGDGVSLRGGRLAPALCFTAAELGFADVKAARALGLESDVPISVVPCLATQGINEEQTIANFLRTHTHEQTQLNLRALATLAEYQHRCASLEKAEAAAAPAAAAAAAAVTAAAAKAPNRAKPAGDKADRASARRAEALGAATRRLQRQRELLAQARRLLETPPESKNVGFLHTVALLTRLMSGARVTMCKSGKDRTAMAVTLEHGLLLQEHGMMPELATHAVGIMRRRGVRRHNVLLNTKRRTYAFNWMQQQALPEGYCPPEGSAAGGKA